MGAVYLGFKRQTKVTYYVLKDMDSGYAEMQIFAMEKEELKKEKKIMKTCSTSHSLNNTM